MRQGPKKPTMDQMLMGMALVAAFRSNCRRAFVGAVATIENRVKSIGYAGSPPGEPECLDVGCDLGPEGGCVRTIHAEANAIAWA
ncbi:MAG: dCMP deaminase, partial [candidate division WOR-3 bacterium]